MRRLLLAAGVVGRDAATRVLHQAIGRLESGALLVFVPTQRRAPTLIDAPINVSVRKKNCGEGPEQVLTRLPKWLLIAGAHYLAQGHNFLPR